MNDHSIFFLFWNLPLHTQAMLVFIVALTILFHLKYGEKTVVYAPTILTTTGIFATFLGIALGLAEFDTGNIQASVPSLLGGLKTAFWASVAGVGGALTLKFRHYFAGTKRTDIGTGAEGEVTADDLGLLLKSIQQSLVGNDESTLVSQLKLTRSDTNDRLDGLKRAQLDALEKLSEMGSKQLVEALRDVIRDFNSKISEQFGENFKQLNDAVGKMLLWQEQYKHHIEQTTVRHMEVVGSMKTSAENYKELVEKGGVFTQVSQDLSGLLTALEAQRHQLTSSLESLAQLFVKASDGLPQIEEKVVGLTRQLSTAVTQNQQEVSNALAENVRMIRTSIQGVGQDFSEINQEFNKKLGDTSEKIKQQVAVLDNALAEELQKSLESLGRQLAALSEKFVADYTPLTERLRAVVQIAAK